MITETSGKYLRVGRLLFVYLEVSFGLYVSVLGKTVFCRMWGIN